MGALWAPSTTEAAWVEAVLALGAQARTDLAVVSALIDRLRSASTGDIAAHIAEDHADSQARGTNPASM
eukprot:SAG11_NODE_11400_length_763_cov_1.010542_1_plen_68_part_10